jgi:hypothetical protein
VTVGLNLKLQYPQHHRNAMNEEGVGGVQARLKKKYVAIKT